MSSKRRIGGEARTIAIAATFAAALWTAPAEAQTASVEATLDRAEANADRIGGDFYEEPLAALIEGAPPPPKNWTLTVALPFTFNNNVASSETGQLSAMHGAPSLELSGKWAVSDTTSFVAGVRTDIDAYTEHDSNDSSGLSAFATLTFGNADTRLTPYLRYTGEARYNGQFGSHKVTTHLFGFGLARNFQISEADKLALDFGYLRREATLEIVEQHRYFAQLRYTGVIDGNDTWSLTSRLQYADFTGGTAASRNDVLLRTTLGYQHRLSQTLTLATDLVFSRNWSDLANKSYSAFDVGPALRITTKF